MSSSPDQLIIFTRLPHPGRNKTRLIPALGAEGAARFHERLARHTVTRALEFCNGAHVRLVILLDGGSADDGIAWLGNHHFKEQGEGLLGERLDRAAQTAFAEGARRVVIIGTDCPELNRDILTDSFRLLYDFPIVLGPAHDGGYYLIGLSEPNSQVFEGIDWGTSQVFAQSIAVAERQGLAVAVLPALADVDLPADIAAAEVALSDRSFPPP